MSCTICYKHKKSIITCSHCPALTCNKCLERYILLLDTDKPFCYQCEHIWSMDFLYLVGSKVFIKRFRSHVADIQVEQEKTLLPATLLMITESVEETKLKEEIARLQTLITQRKRELVLVQESKGDKKQTVIFTGKCPYESCGGYVAASQCIKCHKLVCDKCNTKSDGDHKCNPDDVASYNLIKLDTKSCPKCFVRTYKISGCDQMWCVGCHVAWSWRTGKIETGVIHNPHYYAHHRQDAKLNCGEVPSHHKLLRILKQHQPAISNAEDYAVLELIIPNIVRLIHHISRVVLRRFQNHANDNHDLRVKLLKNEINEEQFKTVLKVRTKKKDFKNDCHQLFNMVVTTLTDLTVKLEHDENVLTFEKECSAFLQYIQKSLTVINNKYGYTRDIHITALWETNI